MVDTVFDKKGMLKDDKKVISISDRITKKSTVSATIIAKNEEANIGRMLKSIQDFCDEIIVVDTGSTDNTISIAKEYGALVYNHPWENDFSKARNQALSYATKEWSFIIDCDEEFFLREGADDLKQVLNQLPENIEAVTLEADDVRDGKVGVKFILPRFFRKGKVFYEGAVHNNPVYQKDKAFFDGAYVKHYGYDLTEEKKKAKLKRTITLLKGRLRDNPNDYAALFYLSQSHGWAGNAKKAIRYALRYVKFKDSIPENDFFQSIYYTLAMQYIKLLDYKEAEKWVKEGLKFNPHDIDCLYAMVLIGVFVRNRQIVNIAASGFVKEYNDYNLYKASGEKSKFVFSYTPENLGYCYYQLSVSALLQAKSFLLAFKDISPLLSSGNLENMKDDLVNTFNKVSQAFLGQENEKTKECVGSHNV